MTATLKEDVNKEIHKRLEKFIDFQYEKYVLEANNLEFLENYHIDIQNTAQKFLKYCKDEIDALCIGVILLEISHLNSFESRAENINNKIKPLLNPGSNELLEAIKAFELNAYNIEEIIIKTKQPKDYITDPNYNPKDHKKGSYLKHLKISGRIAINHIMNVADDEEAIKELQTIANRDTPEKKEPINFFKESAKALYPYLNKYFDHLPSENERYYLGGHLLDSVEIKPKYRNLANLEKDENAYKKAMISNFKKAVKQ